MLTSTQLSTTLTMQAAMNSKVNEKWLTMGFAFCRAIVVEGTEAIEHHGWKWWKAQDKELAQLQMELVDIWHFMLSEYLVQFEGDAQKAQVHIEQQSSEQVIILDGKEFELAKLDCVESLELLIGLATVRRLNVALFESLLSLCEMDWNELFKQYVGKNVLNFFRQDFGYKEGTYEKFWNGKEDNEVLSSILDNADLTQENIQTIIYDQLKAAYPA
ncbi:MAG: dUTP diphosphatase [Saccharospirillaceae bacterium]|nr:dUTP diphosphatase [Pseudomonadales bacterium]NRB79023.1 dUTP diphosphatase [Saccharospirillaceae bacterium]